jgi:hypothetical protein
MTSMHQFISSDPHHKKNCIELGYQRVKMSETEAKLALERALCEVRKEYESVPEGAELLDRITASFDRYFANPPVSGTLNLVFSSDCNICVRLSYLIRPTKPNLVIHRLREGTKEKLHH